MSQNKVPTIPFILPLYQKMETHLEAILTAPDTTFKVQHAVDEGLKKNWKYSVPAMEHHPYILGTSKWIDPNNVHYNLLIIPHQFCTPVCAAIGLQLALILKMKTHKNLPSKMWSLFFNMLQRHTPRHLHRWPQRSLPSLQQNQSWKHHHSLPAHVHFSDPWLWHHLQ